MFLSCIAMNLNKFGVGSFSANSSVMCEKDCGWLKDAWSILQNRPNEERETKIASFSILQFESFMTWQPYTDASFLLTKWLEKSYRETSDVFTRRSSNDILTKHCKGDK